MALLEILPDSDPKLRKTSKRIRYVNHELRMLIDHMYETMVENWGIGLAAIQVGVEKRFFIYEVPKRTVRGYETCKPDNETAGTVVPDDAGAGARDTLVPLNVDPEKVNEELQPDSIGDPLYDVADMDVDEDDDDEDEDSGYTGDYTVCINPRIVFREGKVIEEEGCLSKSGWMAKVMRDYRITFQAFDIDMKKFERTVVGLEARCVAHEIDHLDGILFTDRALPDTLREVNEEDEEEEEDERGERSDTGDVQLDEARDAASVKTQLEE